MPARGLETPRRPIAIGAPLDRDARLRRLSFRAWHRGTKEADLLVGGFFDAHAASWNDEQIGWFEALMEERSATRAGSRLGLTQSAISHALNRLRYVLKDELFVRGPEGMQPWLDYSTALNETGLFRFGMPLDFTSSATTVRVRDEEPAGRLVGEHLARVRQH